MELAELTTFATVARVGSITHAAEELFTVQSNVSARIRTLEQELGVPLFYRNARGVTLTSAGEQLLPYATKISQLVKDAQRAIGDQDVPQGTLRIGSLESTAGHRLPPVLTAYCTAYPQVDITLVTGTTAELIASVREQHLEGALVVGPVNHPDIVAIPILTEDLVLVSSPTLLNLAALHEGHPPKLLVLRSGCSYRQRLEQILAARGIVAGPLLEFGTLDAIIGCAGAGIGITLLPRAVVESARQHGEIALHELSAEEARAHTVFIRRQDAFISAALTSFVKCCHTVLAADAPSHDHA